LVLVAIAGGAAWYLNKTNATSKAPAAPAIAIRTAFVGSGDLAQTIRVAGTVAADKFASIMGPRIQGNRNNFQRGGQGGGGGDFNLVITKLATPGARVNAGDIVAEFDREAQLTRLDDYKDSVIQLDANLNKMKASLAATK